MTPRRAAFSLGSNVGDRLAHLRQAVDALAAEADVTVVAVSGVYETDPVGGPDQADYLNVVVVADTTLEPDQLLHVASGIEESAGRVRSVRWGPRTLDIDLLAVGDVQLESDRLTLPHPRAHERAFVLVPWASVDPDFVVVGRGRVADLAGSVGNDGVRATAQRLVPA